VTYPEKIWEGSAFVQHRIFVLGESWYGDYSDELVTDDGYIRAYLAGRVVDALYTRIANACQLSRQDFWDGVMFTNFVQRVGATRDLRPTRQHFDAAGARLAGLLDDHQPRGVWILGVGQAEYSAPIVERAGIPFEVTAHPTNYGVENATLYASWNSLLEKARIHGTPAHRPNRRPPEVKPKVEARRSADRPAIARSQEVTIKLREGFHSRDAQPDQRMWKNLGYGGKTSSEDTWRYWPQSGAGPWTIAAPLGAAVYTQDNLRLYYEGELIYEAKDGEGQWDVAWQALAHFYGVLARRVAKGTPLSNRPNSA
jgi:hypothetical protein